MSNFDILFKALEQLCGQSVVCMHEEAKGYAFKVAIDGFRKAGKWYTVDRDFLYDFAGI